MLQKSGKDPCAVLLKGVSTNSIFYGGCSSWVHKRYSGISGSLKPDRSFGCKWCTGRDRPVDGRPIVDVTVVREKVEVMQFFCYIGSVYPQVVVEDSLPSQDGVSHRANSMSSCPSSPPARYPSPPEEEIAMCNAPCEWNLGPKLIWSVSPATQLPSHDPLDVWYHNPEPRQLIRFSWEHTAWRSDKGILHSLT